MIATLTSESAPSNQSTQDAPERSKVCLTASMVFTTCSFAGRGRTSPRQPLHFGAPEPGRIKPQIFGGGPPHVAFGRAALQSNDPQISGVLSPRIARVSHEEARERRRRFAVGADVEHGHGRAKID